MSVEDKAQVFLAALTYNKASFLDIPGELGIFRQEAVTWVNHLSAVLNGNLDDFITSQICTNGSVLASLANDVGFVGL